MKTDGKLARKRARKALKRARKSRGKRVANMDERNEPDWITMVRRSMENHRYYLGEFGRYGVLDCIVQCRSVLSYLADSAEEAGNNVRWIRDHLVRTKKELARLMEEAAWDDDYCDEEEIPF